MTDLAKKLREAEAEAEAEEEAEMLQSLTDSELYSRCKEYGLNARLWLRKFAGLLPEVRRRNLYKKRGYISIYEFAAKLAGMNERTVDKILRLYERLKGKSILSKKLESGSAGWSKLEKVSFIATADTDQFWADKVDNMNQITLETYVREYRSKSALKSHVENNLEILQEAEAEAGLIHTEKWETFSFRISPEMAAKLRIFKQQIEKDTGKALSWNEIMLTFMERLQNAQSAREKRKVEIKYCPDCMTKKYDALEREKRVNRHIPSEAREFVLTRSGGRCEYPDCNKAGEIFEHTRAFSIRKNHDPNFIRWLCKGHEGLAHASLINNEEEDPEVWELRDEPEENTLRAYIDEKVRAFRREPLSAMCCETDI